MPNETNSVEAAGDIGNLVLYRMCAEWPKHDDEKIVASKINMIGRVYSASPSRGMAASGGDEFTSSLAKHLVTKGSGIDKALEGLRRNRFPECSKDTVALHEAFDKFIVEFSGDWQLNRFKDRQVHSRASFASKYLHFHAPDAFPILDRYSEIGINHECAIDQRYGKSRYAQFCSNFSALIEKPKFQSLSLRYIDTVLVGLGREIDAKRADERAGMRKLNEGTLSVAAD